MINMPLSQTTISSNSTTRLSMAAENYLLSIFRLEEQGARVTHTVLAEHLKTLPVDEGLGTSLPAVGGMIRRMVREDLVETTAKKDVVLTGQGRSSAESIVRRHRLAERLVVDLLGLELHLAHIEAHRLEHAISPIMEQKIVKALGNPTTCPFGHPIPGSGYSSDQPSSPLDTSENGEKLLIHSIPEDDPKLLKYLVDNNLIPGQPVNVKDADLTRGVITIESSGLDMVFSYDVAAKIRVHPRK